MATPTTLPATFVAGDILTAAQMNDLRGAFRVLQVVYGNTATAATSSTNTYVDTGLTATITPTSASSKVLVFVSQPVAKSTGSANNYLLLRLMRGATQVLEITRTALFTGTALELNGSESATYLDSPATTSATTYKTQFASGNNTAQVAVQPSGVAYATIVLMEISA
jgi:hypothetical protein